MPSELHINSPLNLDLTLEYDQGHRWRPDRKNQGWYTTVLDHDFVRVRQKGKDGPLEFQPCKQEIAQKLRRQFRLNDDDEKIEDVYAQLQRDSKMGALVERYHGLPIMRVDPWECLVFFILSAQNHYQLRVPTAPTANSIDDMAKLFWEDKEWQNDRYPFPSSREVGSESGLDKLHELWPSRTDMPRRIHEAAHFVEAGQLRALEGQPSCEHAVYVLDTMLRGVGPKTAHCVALFGLGYMDAFPVDTHVSEALLSLYGRDPFQPYAGYASQFLFMEGLRNESKQ